MTATTRVEQILLAVQQVLEAAQGVDEAGNDKALLVSVDRVEAVDRAQCPAVNITANTEDATHYGAANHLGRETMRLTFRMELHIYTRGAPPALMAERNFYRIHKRLLADRTLGGLAIVRYATRRWQRTSADEPAGWLVAGYDLTYTASDTDLA